MNDVMFNPKMVEIFSTKRKLTKAMLAQFDRISIIHLTRLIKEETISVHNIYRCNALDYPCFLVPFEGTSSWKVCLDYGWKQEDQKTDTSRMFSSYSFESQEKANEFFRIYNLIKEVTKPKLLIL